MMFVCMVVIGVVFVKLWQQDIGESIDSAPGKVLSCFSYLLWWFLSLFYAGKDHNGAVIYQVSEFCYKMERKG